MNPNIIIVMADQLRCDLRKSQGYPLDTMPFLDSWAESGCSFERAYTPNPTCMPARVSMFTGRYPSCHHVRTNHNVKDILYTQDLLDILKQQGYQTALCGKNHTHRKPADFDYARVNGHQGFGGETINNEAEKEFAEFLCSLRSSESDIPAPGGEEVQFPCRNVNDAIRFIDGRSEEKPFFLWLSFAEPHPPYQVPDGYFDLFPPSQLPVPATGAQDACQKGARYQWVYDTWNTIMPEQYEERIKRALSDYLGMMRLIDDQFRKLIGALRDRKLDSGTTVIFVTDHGDFAGEYGLTRKGPELSQVLSRIPMIWGGFGISNITKDEKHCVNLVDILPTLCALIGARVPSGCQGRNLLPLLQGKSVPEKEFECAYSESGYGGLFWDKNDGLDIYQEGATSDGRNFDTLNTWTQCGQVRMIRKGDYSLQINMMGEGYLYNLREDPRETRNLYSDPAFLTVRAEMLAEMASMLLRTADPLPVPRARYRVKKHPDGYWFDEWHCAEDPGV